MGEAKRKFKTKKELTAAKLYRGYDKWAVGDIVIGEIVDYHTDNYGNKGVVIKVADCQFSKEAKKFEGKRLVINSCGKLKKRLDDLTEGLMIQVEYLGSNVMEKGKYAGKEAHDIDIRIVEEDDGSEESSEEEGL